MTDGQTDRRTGKAKARIAVLLERLQFETIATESRSKQ